MTKVTLSTGKVIEFEAGKFETLMKSLIEEILIPHYKNNNDWPDAIQVTIKEAKQIFKTANMDNYDAGLICLNAIEEATGKEIAQLTGHVNTVEILFQDIDDYLQEIQKMLDAKFSEEKIRLELAKLIEKLNRFEIVELVLALASKKQ
ncbi:MAG: hypothetical protein RBG13Loki_2831 [Promethearchaeota archaeon CR_4]|nr:MAG: hypothetical protein RBG13Loki_2831 [Candidatus Lokiarchaeota archaeon CR_4]